MRSRDADRRGSSQPIPSRSLIATRCRVNPDGVRGWSRDGFVGETLFDLLDSMANVLDDDTIGPQPEARCMIADATCEVALSHTSLEDLKKAYAKRERALGEQRLFLGFALAMTHAHFAEGPDAWFQAALDYGRLRQMTATEIEAAYDVINALSMAESRRRGEPRPEG
jgi:hypothetical protein